MRIGELARQIGMKPSAIRFYEASGLLPEGDRAINGYREYGPAALERLQFIQLAQRRGSRWTACVRPSRRGRAVGCRMSSCWRG